MLGPVLKGGARDFLLDYGPVIQVSFITVSFLPDSTSEKKIERKEEQRVADTLSWVIARAAFL